HALNDQKSGSGCRKNFVASAARSPKSRWALWSPWYALAAEVVISICHSRPRISSFRSSMHCRATEYRFASVYSWSNEAIDRPSVRGRVGRFQPTLYCHQRGSANSPPGGGWSTGTGWIGDMGPKAPSVNTLEGRGRNGP